MMYSLIAFALILGYVQCAPFTATVTLSNNFDIGQDVMCEITIANQENQDHFLYTRHTPFEGFMSKMFLVTLNGSLVPYGSLLFKRGPVMIESNGIRVPAKGSVSLQIDLSSAYSLSHAGKYLVSLDTQVYFLDNEDKVAEQDLKSAPAMFVLIDNGGTPKFTFPLDEAKTIIPSSIYDKVGAPARPVIDASCSAIQRRMLTTAWNTAYKKVSASPNAISADGARAKLWFGIGQMDPVVQNYKVIALEMESAPVRLVCSASCRRGTFAYTRYNGATMTFCHEFDIADASSGFDTQYGVVIHELTHNVCGTDDIKYGPPACRQLAIDRPADAKNNADTYEYFDETL